MNRQRPGRAARFYQSALLWLLLISLAASSAIGAEAGPDVRFLIAQAADQIPESILTPDTSAAQGFMVDGDSGGNGGWWLMTLPAPVAEKEGGRVLYFRQSQSTRIGLLLPDQEELVWRQRFQAPGPAWGVHADLPVLLPSELDAGDTLLVHFSDQSQRRVTPRLADLDDYLQQSARLKAIIIACASALMTMALLCVGFQRGFEDASYGYLSLFAACSAIYVMTTSGEIYLLPGGDLIGPVSIAFERSIAGLSLIFSLLFIIRFLRLERRRPRIRRLLQVLIAAQLLLVLAAWSLAFDPPPIGALAGNVVILLAIPIVLHEALKALRDGIKSGLFVLLAWTPSLLILTIWIAALQGWLYWQVDLLPWVFIGLVLQVAVLSFGLAEEGYRLRRERDQAETRADLDPLTGLLNRRGLDRRLRELSAAADQTSDPLTLLFLDLDHFKKINDSLGHAVGDDCLRHLARLVTSGVRTTDPIARYGGEEFVVILPGLDSAGAVALAEGLRQRIESTPLASDDGPVHLKASLGLSCWQAGRDSVAALLERADQALYRAKSEGRNRVVVAAEAEDSPVAPSLARP